ncbi:MAG: toxin-antitoxin system YwqK family antitoxin, partial [Helicobacter sp.]|uniref:toxin-antitoxin system YwqK family antitoxin n=1 Tax=Helicobacter sp. TaxID=218 RepID=UPI002A9162BD
SLSQFKRAVMLLKSVFMALFSFSILHADTLKECKTEADKISGCVVKEYDENGKLEIEIPYKNDKAEGIAKVYYENGNLEFETPFKNDKIEGIAKVYFESGNLNIEIPYKNGKKEGIKRWYYANGNLEGEIPYKNGKREGTAKEYDKMGNLQIEMSFLNDMLQGDIRFYITDKKLLALLKVENGEFISGKCFDDKVLTDKEIDDLSRPKSIEESINYLKEICSK